MRLYVIRHGQSHVNVGDWATLDSMDAGLTEKGHQQAVALRDWLKENGRTCDALYASTMLRTQETARYVKQVQVIYIAKLNTADRTEALINTIVVDNPVFMKEL